MLLFCIDNCRWWTLIITLHNSTAKHVDVGNIEQVEPVQDNDEHVDVPMPGKKTPSWYFLNGLLVFIKIKIY